MTESFIMVTQTKQVFYVTDPSNLSRRWSIILPRKYIPHIDEKNYIPSTLSYATKLPTLFEEVAKDDVHVIRNDHQEGMWEN